MTALYIVLIVIFILILVYRQLTKKAKKDNCDTFYLFPGQKKNRYNKIKKGLPYLEQIIKIRKRIEKIRAEKKKEEKEIKEITLENLKKALENSWRRETSADPNEWTPENPAWGQCAVTAKIVQDYFGGSLVRYDLLSMGSHYSNQLPDGSEIDLTESQFSEGIIKFIRKYSPKEIRTGKYVLSHPDTVKRYKLLKQETEKFLKKDL